MGAKSDLEGVHDLFYLGSTLSDDDECKREKRRLGKKLNVETEKKFSFMDLLNEKFEVFLNRVETVRARERQK